MNLMSDQARFSSKGTRGPIPKPFDLNLYMSQAKDFHSDIISNLLKKATKFDKGIFKIGQYFKNVGIQLDDLEQAHCFIIQCSNANIFK